MKNILSILFMAVAIFSAKAQQEPVETDKGYKIEIKTSAVCEMCKETLESDLVFEKGVKSAQLNLENMMMEILYNPKRTDAEQLRKRISQLGYNADTVARDPKAYEKLPWCCKDGGHDDDGK
jgi:cation transport ATPase